MSHSGVPVFYMYVCTEEVILGIIVGRHIEKLRQFKERIEAGISSMDRQNNSTNLTNVEMLVEKSSMDKKILDACNLIRNKDLLYLPVNVLPHANLRRIMPPHYYRLNFVQLVSEHYSQCKVDSVLEAALVCDLTLFPGENAKMNPAILLRQAG